MHGLSIPGQGSGIDIDAVVGSLVAGRVAAEERELGSRQQRLEEELSMRGRLYSGGALLESSCRRLADESVRPVVMSSRPDCLEATVAVATIEGKGFGDRLPDSFSVAIERLARPFRMHSKEWKDDTEFGPCELKLSLIVKGQVEADASIAIPDNAKLADVVKAINEEAGSLASARLVPDGKGYRIVVTAREYGAARKLKIEKLDQKDDDGGLVASFKGGKDGGSTSGQGMKCEIDGVSLSGDSNRIQVYPEGLEQRGLALHLLRETPPGAPAQVSVTMNQAELVMAVEDVVREYNRFRDTMRESAVGAGGAAARRLSAELERSLGEFNTNPDSVYRSLAEMGVTRQRDGRLALEEAQLRKALHDRPSDVFFLVSSDQGPCGRLLKRLETFAKTGLGGESGMDRLERDLARVQAGRVQLEKRRTELTERLRSEFEVMERTVRHWQAQKEALEGLLPSRDKEGAR